ncbi:hypothetical protein J4G33_02990 [Actinotalea sp. BY-33]|uniref:Mycothiol-dependent maleylpyruvate isomerase metal-binding domain-containing protein n=1 Tax=Actinotalea soli TaxID=2819234 RepID=A0A939RV42_9CELL|nr:maleylpyruvate isomerase N-terminal domain-containing protein [Actinotalea soli]MBO1750761.1 hypothetical protein [Actinotalea soli]
MSGAGGRAAAAATAAAGPHEDAARLVDAVGWLADHLLEVPEADWDLPAAGLEWTCRRTVEHLCDDLLAYALQLTGARASTWAREDYLPLTSPTGGADLVAVTTEAGTPGIVASLRTLGHLMGDTLAATDDDVRAYHPWGVTDRTGYAAVGILETLVHGHDLLTGLGTRPDLPAGPAAAAVRRLFPDAPTQATATDPGLTLLWCTGRLPLALPGITTRPRRDHWLPRAQTPSDVGLAGPVRAPGGPGAR